MSNFKNSFLYTVIFIFVISFIFVFMLSFLNVMAEGKIAARAKLEQNIAILSSMGIKTDVLSQEEINNQFSQITQEERGGHIYYIMDENGSKIYASNFSGPGLWGIIKGYIATDQNISKIIGFSIASQSETPGLGARIAEEWFLEQLRGEKITDAKIIVRKGGKGDTDKNNGIIDGISGATVTSNSVQAILSNEINRFMLDWNMGGKEVDSPETRNKRKVLASLGVDAISLSKEEVDNRFAEVRTEIINDHSYYVYSENGGDVYSTAFTSKGFHGDIVLLIGVDKDMTRVMGFSVLEHKEQMGKAIEEQWFLDQIKEETLQNGSILIFGSGTGDSDKNNGFIDGISGATKTSATVQIILNNAIEQFTADLK